MRALKILVVVMGVMIVVGVIVLVATLVQRAGGTSVALAPDAKFSEPAGTHIAGTSLSGDRVALQLQGGGPDRVVVIDLRTGRVVGRAGLTE